MTSFVYGCKVGYQQSTTRIFFSPESPFDVSESDMSWMASISSTGTLISVVLCFTLSNKVSWKVFITGSAVSFTLSWLLILVSSSPKIIVACFFVYGVAASILVITAHVYFTEVASPANRGCIILLYFLATDFGILVENLMSTFGSYRLLAAFPLVMGVVTLVLSFFMVESPYFLLSKGRDEEALDNLRYLQDKTAGEDTSGELKTMKKYMQEQRGIDVNDFQAIFLPGNLKLLGTIILIKLPGTFSCNTIIYAYGPLLIRGLEPHVNGRTFIYVYGLMKTVCDVLSLGTVKKFNRYTLLVFGQVALAVIQLAIFLCFFLEKQNNFQSDAFVAYAIAILLVGLMIVGSLTCDAAIEVYKAEVFPHRLKEFYMSVIAFLSDSIGFVAVKSYFWLFNLLGIDYLVLFYSSCSLLGAVFSYFLIQETKGKSLNQIRTDYGTSLEK